MVELGRTRDWLLSARPADVEAARFRLYVGRLAQDATEPFETKRRIAQIELIDEPKRRDREARSFNRERVESLRSAERSQAALRALLELDDPDDVDESLDDEDAPTEEAWA